MMKNKDNLIKLFTFPQFFKTVMLVVSLECSVIPFVCAAINTFGIAKADFWLTVAEGIPFFLLALISGAICWFWTMWKVEMYQDYFVYRNYFGIKKKYRYEDLTTDLTKSWSKTFFYLNGKKVLSMPYRIEDEDDLRKMVEKRRKAKERLERDIKV